MPTVNEGPEEILLAMERQNDKHGDISESVPLEDACLSNVQEVAPDTRQTEDNMVKTVPYAIAIPHTTTQDISQGDDGSERFTPVKLQGDEGSERFTPVTEKSPTPAPVLLQDEPEIFISSRPSSAAPSRLRSAGKERRTPPQQKVQFEPLPSKKQDLMDLLPPRRPPQPGISFKELTAEFDRMLKPLKQQMTSQTAGYSDDYYYDTSGDCCHPILAIEPRNPATPPRSFKIHKQRTVLKPGYSYVEPVLLDLPVNPDTLTTDGIESILEIAHNMRPLPPRIDNYSHDPPSRHLTKPCFYVPRPHRVSRNPVPAPASSFGGNSKCSSSQLKF